MRASPQSVRLGGPHRRSLREMVTGGLAVALFTATAFLTFGHDEPGISGPTSEHASRAAVVDVRWVPKWTAASARAVAATGEPTMDPRWLPKQYLDAALTSQAG